MSDTAETAPAPRRSRRPLLIGLGLMLLLAGAGFYAVYAGLLLGDGAEKAAEADAQGEVSALPDIAFVPIEPLVVSLGADAGGRFLHFTAQMEVAKDFESDVTLLLPSILDVLNSYLRAVETRELADPTALVRLRAQMLRRIQLVTGGDRVRDLLITEFVIN